MNTVLIGFTSCGKSTVGKALAELAGLSFIDLDAEIETLAATRTGERLSCRELFRKHGEAHFRKLECDALRELVGRRDLVLATGGGAPLSDGNRVLLRQLGTVVYLRAQPETIFARMQAKGLPAYLAADPSVAHLRRIWAERDPLYSACANDTLAVDHLSPAAIAAELLRRWHSSTIS